ncbi:MAG: ribonuclease P protein subunit [archaeon]|nr:ribonuclease P protein subunit [archaeon]
MFSRILIGEKIRIIQSSDPTLIQRSGMIIDETRNILKIADDAQKPVSIPKSSSIFELEFEGKRIVLPGREIVGTPQERIHKV